MAADKGSKVSKKTDKKVDKKTDKKTDKKVAKEVPSKAVAAPKKNGVPISSKEILEKANKDKVCCARYLSPCLY